MSVTRKEKLLSAIANGTSSPIEPVTREEQLLSDIANGTASKVSPITRKEMLLSAISKGQKPNIDPITREEQYLAYIGGESTKIPEAPITSTEFWLDKIANGGGGGGGGDQTALAGAYIADGTFSNRVYTWDKLVANFENGTPPNFGDDEEGIILWARGYDVVVPDTVICAGYMDCTNVVLPATTAEVAYTDCIDFETIYIKATTPPDLESDAFYEMLHNSSPEQLAKFKIVVPIGCGNAYKSATGWCDYAEYIKEGKMPI